MREYYAKLSTMLSQKGLWRLALWINGCSLNQWMPVCSAAVSAGITGFEQEGGGITVGHFD